MLLSKVWEYQPKSYLNGLSIIKWKTTQISTIWHEAQEIKIKSKLEIHWLKAVSVKKLLGVKFNHKSTFDQHVKSLCKKGNVKLKVFGRLVPYMGLAEKKLQMNSFFPAQCNYCQLIWIIHNRSNNNRVKYLHGRFTRLI